MSNLRLKRMTYRVETLPDAGFTPSLLGRFLGLRSGFLIGRVTGWRLRVARILAGNKWTARLRIGHRWIKFGEVSGPHWVDDTESIS